MSTWQPIATAPQGGEKIDLWVEQAGTPEFSDRVTDCWWSGGEWLQPDQTWGEVSVEDKYCRATHWMPRPAPPAT